MIQVFVGYIERKFINFEKFDFNEDLHTQKSSLIKLFTIFNIFQ